MGVNRMYAYKDAESCLKENRIRLPFDIQTYYNKYVEALSDRIQKRNSTVDDFVLIEGGVGIPCIPDRISYVEADDSRTVYSLGFNGCAMVRFKEDGRIRFAHISLEHGRDCSEMWNSYVKRLVQSEVIIFYPECKYTAYIKHFIQMLRFNRISEKDTNPEVALLDTMGIIIDRQCYSILVYFTPHEATILCIAKHTSSHIVEIARSNPETRSKKVYAKMLYINSEFIKKYIDNNAG